MNQFGKLILAMSIIIILLLYACEPYMRQNIPFKKKLDRQLEVFHKNNLDSLIFHLDSLTDFEWERLYVIQSGSIKNVDKILGFEWKSPPESNSGGLFSFDDGDEDFFVFTKGNKVVSYSYFSNNDQRYYFGIHIGGHTYYTPQTATFKILGVLHEKSGIRDAHIHEAIPQQPNVLYFMNQ